MPQRRDEFRGKVCARCGGYKVHYARACRKCLGPARPWLGKTGAAHPTWKHATPTKETLHEILSPEPNSGCWLWTGRVNRDGYGMLTVDRDGRRRPGHLAHRQLWEMHRGQIAPGLCVLHSCDTPACCNPDHLWLGTHQENMADMRRKGRHVRPSGGAGRPKLTPMQVEIIRSGKETCITYAKQFGVHKATVHRIRSGTSWLR